MAASTEKDIAEHLATIRADIAVLTGTVSQLAAETAGIHTSLRQRVSNAAKDAFGAGERMLSEAEKLGGEAMHAAERGTTAAVTGVQKEIERNPLSAVLIALGFGVAIGFFLRK